jgi:hypothetical protein
MSAEQEVLAHQRMANAMTLSRVQHALGMMRVYVVECTTQNDEA